VSSLTDNIKTAFDGIRAEDNLKANTTLYLQTEMQKSNKVRVRTYVRRFAAAFAAVAIIVLSGVFSYDLYFTPMAYIDVDVNPSIELTLNRFYRVIGVHAYNEDGASILSGISLKHERYEEALVTIMETVGRGGYIQDGGLVSVTLQTDNAGREAELLTSVQSNVTSYIAGNHHEAQIEIFAVNGDTQSRAHEHNISPATYLAIQGLIEVDPTVTVESCRGHTIIEIRRQTHGHSGGHHGGGNIENESEPIDGGDSPTNEHDTPHDTNNGNVQDSGHGNGHHGNGGRGRHHGEVTKY
jgi:hypothetical protein